jgi:tetratricopeptide (TPR) repeat protein
VQASFARSFVSLPADAQTLFAALAAFETAEFGRQAVWALAEGLGLADPRGIVDLVVRRALLDAFEISTMPPTSDLERLRLHALLRGYAEAEFRRWTDADRQAVALAVAEHFATYANEMPDWALGPDEGNIASSIEWALAYRQDELVLTLCVGMKDYWRDHFRTQPSLRYLPWAVAVAETQLGERPDAKAEKSDSGDVQAWQRREQTLFRLLLAEGRAYQLLNKLDTAVECYERCSVLARQAEDSRQQAMVLTCLGQVALERGKLEEAEGYYHPALVIFREVQDRRGEGVVLYSLALIAEVRGDLDRAEALHRRVWRSLSRCRMARTSLIPLGIWASSSSPSVNSATRAARCSGRRRGSTSRWACRGRSGRGRRRKRSAARREPNLDVTPPVPAVS